jgi:hypothetical protein
MSNRTRQKFSFIVLSGLNSPLQLQYSQMDIAYFEFAAPEIISVWTSFVIIPLVHRNNGLSVLSLAIT